MPWMKCAYGASLKWSWQCNWSTGRKTHPSATVSTTNPTWTEERSNLWLYGELTFIEWETKDKMEWYYRKTHQFEVLKTEISVFKLPNFELVHVTLVNFWVLWPPCLTLELNLPECNTNFDFALLVLYLRFTKFSKHWPYSVYRYCDDTTGLLLGRQYLAVAVLQAAQIARLMTISTGTKSAILLPWQSIVRKNPFPAAAISPVGPFKLSTHPATGSRKEDNTEKKEQPLLVWFIFRIFHNSILTVQVHHHHHISVMELGHLLTCSGLSYPEVSSKVCHDSFCQLGNSISLPWVIYYGAFYLYVVSSFSCIPVICLKLVLFLISLQFLPLFCNQSKCILYKLHSIKYHMRWSNQGGRHSRGM